MDGPVTMNSLCSPAGPLSANAAMQPIASLRERHLTKYFFYTPMQPVAVI